MLYAGIDLHKRSVVIHTVDDAGTTVREASLPTSRPAVAAYFRTLAGAHRAVVKCTGTWYWMRDVLVTEGVDLRLGHAKYLKAISYAKVKTDRIDARTLAQLLRVSLVPEAHMIGPGQRETRDLLRARLQLITRRTRCQHSISSLLGKYNISTAAEFPEFPRLQATWQAEQQALLTQQIKALDTILRTRLIPTPEAQRLVWVPGLGAIVAPMLLLEIDDIRRFPSVRHFHSYCRLAPGADNSGGKTRHTRSKDGNRSLKLAVHHAAIQAVRYAPEIAAQHRRWERRKGKRIARALVAKELATIVYAILSKQEDYNGRFKGQPVALRKRPQWPRLTSPPSITERSDPPRD